MKIARTFRRACLRFFPPGLHKPCFVVGCGRSGTSLLARCLAAHPETAVYPGEANELWHPHAYPWHACPLHDRLPPYWKDPAEFTRVSLASRSLSDTRHLLSAFRRFRAASGNPVFVNKSAMIAFMLRDIVNLFPDARFIHIVRDGRAAAASYARKQYDKSERYPEAFAALGKEARFDAVLDACARCWQGHVREISRRSRELALGDRFLEIRYEGLCEDPAGVLRGIADFLGLPPAGFAPVAGWKIGNRNTDTLCTLSPKQLESVTAVMREDLVHWGYIQP